MGYHNTAWNEWDLDERFEDAPPYSKLRVNENTSHPLFDPELVWDFLNQKKIWVNKYLLEIPVKEMDKSYLFNVLKWVDKNWEEIGFTLAYARKLEKFDDEYGEFRMPVEFPLFEKIEKRYLKLNGIKSEPKEQVLYG